MLSELERCGGQHRGCHPRGRQKSTSADKDRLVQLADRSEIIKLGTYLQTRHELSFLQVSRLLDLKSGQCIYNETTRPDMRYGA